MEMEMEMENVLRVNRMLSSEIDEICRDNESSLKSSDLTDKQIFILKDNLGQGIEHENYGMPPDTIIKKLSKEGF